MPSNNRDGTSPGNGDGRSPSPGAKRSASEIADSDPEGGVSTAVGSGDAHESETGTGTEDQSPYPTPSSVEKYTATTSTRKHSKAAAAAITKSHDVPSIDDQVAQVTAQMMQPLQDGQKGYVISMTWLKKVLARSSTHGDKTDKEALESELGPVDNTDIVLDTDPETSGFKDETGEPYVPMRPGLQMGDDFDIVPQPGWDLIMKWYGLADQSPIIVRYAHNTNPAGDIENVMYELNPPIFTIFKLSNPSAGTTPQSLKEKNMPAAKALASRQSNFQKWLKEVKQLARIDMSTKVRVWKILGGLRSANQSGSATPAVSRSASPAPASALIPSANRNLLVDLNTFLSLSEGSQRLLLEGVKDQTANPNYNGRMTLDMAGLAGTDIVVLEEQVDGSKGGEWVSEASTQTLKRLGIPVDHPKKDGVIQSGNKSPAPSGRSTPAPEARGRRARPLGLTGLENLGNTCYMNAATQCVRGVEELTYYFLSNSHKRDLNPDNPLAYHGAIAKAYSAMLREIYRDPPPTSFCPSQFRRTIGRYNPAMSGFEQHDSQEFLMFLLDGLSEDLNRILKKPYIEKPDSTDEMVHDREALEKFAVQSWDIYKARNDSVITDLFAGMYKSTLVCPVCDKVSIIFDPFSSLTLPIPSLEPFAREIVWVSQDRKPVKFTVELDRNATLKGWKEAAAKKMNADPERVIATETYNGTFWKLFDNDSLSVHELRISPHDIIVFYEVESVPTSANNKGILRTPPKFSSPEADRTLVPIFHRRPVGNRNRVKRETFALPALLVFTREEAQDPNAVYRKILGRVAAMTTRDILNEHKNESVQAAEDPDTVVMNEEDAQSADSRIKTCSVEGEDNMVDISMHDAPSTPGVPPQEMEEDDEPPPHPLADSIAPGLLSLFDAKVAKTNEVLPMGRSIEQFKDYQLLSSRFKPESVQKKADSTSQSSSDAPSEDYSDIDGSDSETNGASAGDEAEKWPLICPGDAIVIDWNEDALDALFGGNRRETDALRGAPTYEGVEVLPDPELTRRRAMREERKARGISLDECLDEFSKEEILSETDAWYCPRCKEHRQARKKFELWKAPDILVIHLKRFGAQSRYVRMKLDTLVDFPLEGLDMSSRVEGPDDGKALLYDLIGVDNHSGTMGGGHYTAYAKNFITDDWCSFNDSSASVVKNPQQVVSSRAYLLFYRRRSDRPLGGPVIQEIVNSYKQPPAEGDSLSASRGQSPSGEGQRLGDSSRNGSSSALVGVGAAHQAGDGGLRTGHPATTKDEHDSEDDELAESGPGSARAGRLEGMHFTGDGDEFELDDETPQFDDPLSIFKEPSWSFDRVREAHGLEQMTAAPAGSFSNGAGDDDGLFNDNDNASNVAVGDGDMDELDSRLLELDGSPPRSRGNQPSVSEAGASFEDVPSLLKDDSDDDELPVVELRVGEDEKVVSD